LERERRALSGERRGAHSKGRGAHSKGRRALRGGTPLQSMGMCQTDIQQLSAALSKETNELLKHDINATSLL